METTHGVGLFATQPEAEAPAAARPPWPWPVRLALLFAGVVLPVVCFALGFPVQPEWQSGNLDAYLQLLLARKASLPLYPFLLYNMTCMALVLASPQRFAKHFVVRFGIYTGVVLAVQYWLLFWLALDSGSPAAALGLGTLFSVFGVAIPWGIGWVATLLARRYRRRAVWALAIVALLVTAAAAMWAVFSVTGFPDLAAGLLVLCLFCSTPWAVASYATVAWSVVRRSGLRRLRFSLGQLLAVLTWVAGYLAAWRTAVHLMLQEYARLPTTPPDDCYVCTAAARGHRRLVGGEEYPGPDGTTARVNDQMRRLKAAELALRSVVPGAHRACRRIYDRWGPPLAAALVHPILADLAYVSLKPSEWLARALLAVLSPGSGRLVREIYRGRRAK